MIKYRFTCVNQTGVTLNDKLNLADVSVFRCQIDFVN